MRPEDYLKSSLASERNNVPDAYIDVWDSFINNTVDIADLPEKYTDEYYCSVHYFEPADYSRVIIYLHGGAYFKNITEKQVITCYYLSQKFNAKVYMPLYPVAPQSCVDYCFDYLYYVYKEIVLTKDPGKELILAGDSAGGGLAISITQFIYNYNQRKAESEPEFPMPDARILYSPWCDLSMSNNRIASREDSDVFLSQYGLKEIGKIWASLHNTMDYKVSPVYGEFEDKVPTIIFHGSDEVLYPDSILTAEKMAKAGGRVRFVVGKGLFHVYPIFIYSLPEAKEALDMAYDFVVNKK